MTVPRLSALSDLPYTRIPTRGNPGDLTSLCIERGRSLSAVGRFLYVPLSGGVDSTMAAVALALAGSRPLIGLSDTGAQFASPELLSWLQSQGCSIEHCGKESIRKAFDAGMTPVTGTHGDNLFLGDISFQFPELIESVWDMTPDEMLLVVTGRTGVMSAYSHLFDEMPSHLPRSAANLLWWISFCQRWHLDNLYLTADIEIGEPGYDHIHFFDTDDFQLWMMQDASIKCGKSWANHKDAIANAIRSITGLDIDLPTKTTGWCDIRPMQGGTLIHVTDDWQFLRSHA